MTETEEKPKCACCANEGIYIHAVCHIDAQLVARFTNGQLALFCGQCMRPIVCYTVKGRI